MAIRCIALDLDRTTLNREGRLSLENKASLEAVIAAGIYVVVASGRAFDTLPQDILELSGIEYAVTCNGAAVYHMPTRKCLRQFKLARTAIEAIMQATAKEPVTYEAFIDGIAYADKQYLEDPVRFGASPQAVEYVRATRHIQDNIIQFIDEHKHHMDSMDIIVKDEEEKRRIWGLVENVAEDVYITSSVRQLVEIADRNAGKKAGVAFVADFLGLRRDEIAAFGDADNDVDMLQYAGCGIAMENATEACKEAADFVTKHHDKDGLAYGLKNILKLC